MHSSKASWPLNKTDTFKMLQLYAYTKEKYTKVLTMQWKWNQRLGVYTHTGYFHYTLSHFNKLLTL